MSSSPFQPQFSQFQKGENMKGEKEGRKDGGRGEGREEMKKEQKEVWQAKQKESNKEIME